MAPSRDQESFEVGEKLLCFWGPILYDADVLKVKDSGEKSYLVRFKIDKVRKWVKVDHLVKRDKEGMEYQRELWGLHGNPWHTKRNMGFKKDNKRSNISSNSDRIFSLQLPRPFDHSSSSHSMLKSPIASREEIGSRTPRYKGKRKRNSSENRAVHNAGAVDAKQNHDLPGLGSKRTRQKVQALERPWDSEDDDILVIGHKTYGPQWDEISKLISRRTTDVKKRWDSAMTKVSNELQIQPEKTAEARRTRLQEYCLSLVSQDGATKGHSEEEKAIILPSPQNRKEKPTVIPPEVQQPTLSPHTDLSSKEPLPKLKSYLLTNDHAALRDDGPMPQPPNYPPPRLALEMKLAKESSKGMETSQSLLKDTQYSSPPVNPNARGKRFPCTFCQRLFVSPAKLQMHLRTHTGEKPFSCGICKKKFRQKTHLQSHERIHTGEKPFECPQCFKRCNNKSNFNKHLRIHTGERPYGCAECGRTFTQKSNLTKHMQIHRQPKNHLCFSCGARFHRASHLKTHMRIHNPMLKEKPKNFECALCGHTFSTGAQLRRHLRVHTGEKPFECKFCGRKFTQNGSLGRHIRVRHRTCVDNDTVKNVGKDVSNQRNTSLIENSLLDDPATTIATSNLLSNGMGREETVPEPVGESLPSLVSYLSSM